MLRRFLSGCGVAVALYAATLALPAPARAESADKFPMAEVIGGQFVDLSATAVALIVTSNLPGGDYQCTGVLVGADLVLTAAHCIAASPQYYTVVLNQKLYSVSKAYYNGRYDPYGGPAFSNSQHDTGMLVLSSKPAGISPIPVLINDPVNAGETGSVVGFGSNERSGSSEIPLWIGKVGGIRVEEVSEGMISSSMRRSEASTCHGDSGGPLLQAPMKSEFLVVAGVVSTGTNRDDTSGNCVENYSGLSNFVDLQSATSREFLEYFSGVKYLSGRLVTFFVGIKDVEKKIEKLKRSTNLASVKKQSLSELKKVEALNAYSDAKRAVAAGNLRKTLTGASKSSTLEQAKSSLNKASRFAAKLVSYSAY